MLYESKQGIHGRRKAHARVSRIRKPILRICLDLRHLQTLFHLGFHTDGVTKKELIFHFLRPRNFDPPLLTEHLRGNFSKVGREEGCGAGQTTTIQK